MHFLNKNFVVGVCERNNRWDRVRALALFNHVVRDHIGDLPVNLFLLLFQLVIPMIQSISLLLIQFKLRLKSSGFDHIGKLIFNILELVCYFFKFWVLEAFLIQIERNGWIYFHDLYLPVD